MTPGQFFAHCIQAETAYHWVSIALKPCGVRSPVVGRVKEIDRGGGEITIKLWTEGIDLVINEFFIEDIELLGTSPMPFRKKNRNQFYGPAWECEQCGLSNKVTGTPTGRRCEECDTLICYNCARVLEYFDHITRIKYRWDWLCGNCAIVVSERMQMLADVDPD